ncbi:hypothetical protein [Longimicrobium sp.]|jgi:hypothetical protein|uniref:hypothetical protein n=1 Tax=Longimicrobium sp. TaxID=2029185 RepID=UPI002ED84F80
MTAPRTDRNVRKLRHSIRKRAFWIFQLTKGLPGATQEQQVQILDKQISLLTEALEKAKEAREIVSTRDFDAYKAAKDAAAAAPEVEKVADSEQKQMEALTFQDLVAQLSGNALATEPEQADKPKDDTPPF